MFQFWGDGTDGAKALVEAIQVRSTENILHPADSSLILSLLFAEVKGPASRSDAVIMIPFQKPNTMYFRLGPCQIPIRR